MQQDVIFLDDTATLSTFCHELANSSWLAVDTEFQRESTYFPQLCLLQIASQDRVGVIDPLVISDLSPLRTLLLNTGTTKVLHAAKQDMEIFYHLWGEIPSPLFDTQVAAALLGGKDQIGYAALVDDVFSIKLDKSMTRTDWRQRPLSREQLCYAEQDVRYLGELYVLQQKQLQQLDRLLWVEEDCAELVNPRLYSPSPESVWLRIKEARRLTPRQCLVLQRLAAWREKYAMSSDKPRRWIIKDECLVALAVSMPQDIGSLSNVGCLGKKFILQRGEDLLNSIREIENQPDTSLPMLDKGARMTTEQEALVKSMLHFVRNYAKKYDLAPSLLATRKDIEAMVKGRLDVKATNGWRLEVVGKSLLELSR